MLFFLTSLAALEIVFLGGACMGLAIGLLAWAKFDARLTDELMALRRLHDPLNRSFDGRST